MKQWYRTATIVFIMFSSLEALASHLVTAMGGGPLFVSDLRHTQHFPIQNPAQDEFYTYQTQSPSSTAGFFDLFVGLEQPLSSLAAFSDYQIQVGFNYHQPSVLRVQGVFTQGLDAQSADTYRFQYQTIPHQLLAETKLLYKLKAHFYPYVFGGIGVSIHSTSQYTTNVPPFLTFTRQYQNNTNSSFTYALGAGVDWEIIPSWRCGVAWRWNDFGTAQLGASSIRQLHVNGALSLSNVSAHELVLQLSKIW